MAWFILIVTALGGLFGAGRYLSRPRLSLSLVSGWISTDSAPTPKPSWEILRGRPFRLDVVFKIENRYGRSVEGSVINVTTGPLVNLSTQETLHTAELRAGGKHFASLVIGTLNPGEIRYPASLVIWFPDTVLEMRPPPGADSVSLELDTLVATLTANNRPAVRLVAPVSLRVGRDSAPVLVLEGHGTFRLSRDIPLGRLLR